MELELEKWRDKGKETNVPATYFLGKLINGIEYFSGDVILGSDDNMDKYVSSENKKEVTSNILKEQSVYPLMRTNINGKMVYWILNNNIYTNPHHIRTVIPMCDVMAYEVKSAALVTDKDMIAKLCPIHPNHILPDQIFMVYERPNSYLYRSNKEVTKRKVWGYTPQKKFYSPNYYQMMLPKEPDTRRTLYWSPNLFIDDLGKASVVFFNNSHDGTQLRISIQGITQDGRMVSYER